MHALVLLCINLQMKFEVPSFTNSKDMIGAKFKKDSSRGSDHAKSVIRGLACDIFHLHTKFGDSRFSRPGDVIADVKIKKWVM